MDLLSWPEVFAADYVIKSIIISVWAPLLLLFHLLFPAYLSGTVGGDRRTQMHKQTHSTTHTTPGRTTVKPTAFIINIPTTKQVYMRESEKDKKHFVLMLLNKG